MSSVCAAMYAAHTEQNAILEMNCIVERDMHALVGKCTKALHATA